MGSRYDNITTASSLVSDVIHHGLSTATDDIVRVQDILGKSSIGELEALANDNGRMNDKGEPDPKGKWSSGRAGTRNVFYQILFTAWHWQDAVRFYNTHSNDEMKAIQAALEQSTKLCNKTEAEKEDVHKQLKEMQEIVATVLEEHEKKKAEKLDVEIENEKLKNEILRLKAKLYDIEHQEEENE